MQQMQDMFLSKFKKLKQKNKVLFNKAMKSSSGKVSPVNEEEGKKELEKSKSTEPENNPAAKEPREKSPTTTLLSPSRPETIKEERKSCDESA